MLEAALTGWLCRDPSIAPWSEGYDPEVRAIGRDWPAPACTMIRTTRMRNLCMLAESVIEDGVAGGGCLARRSLCMYMRGIRAAYGVVERKYLVVDVLPACRQAVHDFRERYGVSEPIQDIDGAGVFWRKEA